MKAVAVFATLAGSATATDLSLSWSDCGAGKTHAKIMEFSPSFLTLGQKTTMTGTGQLDEAVSGAKFDLIMNGAIGQLLKCDGDAEKSKTCSLPLGVGSLTFDAMSFPLAAGSVPVNVDIKLAANLPSSLASTTTTCKATSSSGDDLFCIEIKSAPADETTVSKADEYAELTDLELSWSDCGSGSTHARITEFTPSSLTLGQKTTMTGTGQLDEAVAGAKFDLVMNGAIGQLLKCDGDASQSKTCSLPLGVGSLTFDAMKFPLAAGSVPVNVDINLAASLPSSLAKTKTTCKATASNGDDLFCIEIDSKPQSRIPAKIAKLEEQSGVSQLALTWSDCGAGATHAKIIDFSPSSLTLGKKTTMTGTGQLDEAVTGATFDLVMNGAIGQLLKCDGDASQSKTCQLPLGVGSLTFDAMTFPLAAGNVPVNVDIELSATLPSSLTVTKTTCKATSNSGDDLFCIEITSAPAMTVIV